MQILLVLAPPPLKTSLYPVPGAAAIFFSRISTQVVCCVCMCLFCFELTNIFLAQEIGRCAGHGRFCRSLESTPANNSFLLSSSYDKTIRLWDLRTSDRQVLRLSGHTGSVTAAHFVLNMGTNFILSAVPSPDNNFLFWLFGLIWVRLICGPYHATVGSKKDRCTCTQNWHWPLVVFFCLLFRWTFHCCQCPSRKGSQHMFLENLQCSTLHFFPF